MPPQKGGKVRRANPVSDTPQHVDPMMMGGELTIANESAETSVMEAATFEVQQARGAAKDNSASTSTNTITQSLRTTSRSSIPDSGAMYTPIPVPNEKEKLPFTTAAPEPTTETPAQPPAEKSAAPPVAESNWEQMEEKERVTKRITPTEEMEKPPTSTTPTSLSHETAAPTRTASMEMGNKAVKAKNVLPIAEAIITPTSTIEVPIAGAKLPRKSPFDEAAAPPPAATAPEKKERGAVPPVAKAIITPTSTIEVPISDAKLRTNVTSALSAVPPPSNQDPKAEMQEERHEASRDVSTITDSVMQRMVAASTGSTPEASTAPQRTTLPHQQQQEGRLLTHIATAKVNKGTDAVPLGVMGAVQVRAPQLDAMYTSYYYIPRFLILTAMDGIPYIFGRFLMPTLPSHHRAMLQHIREAHVRPYRAEEAADAALLGRLWEGHNRVVFAPDSLRFDPARHHAEERWKDMGFQGVDPATDFRGAGRFGLMQLVYLVENHPEDWNAMLAPDFMTAAAGLNISMRLMTLLGINDTVNMFSSSMHTTYSACAGEVQLCNFISDQNMEVSVRRLNEVYCFAMRLLNYRWKKSHHNIMEFNMLLSSTYVELERLLFVCSCLEELRGLV